MCSTYIQSAAHPLHLTTHYTLWCLFLVLPLAQVDRPSEWLVDSRPARAASGRTKMRPQRVVSGGVEAKYVPKNRENLHMAGERLNIKCTYISQGRFRKGGSFSHCAQSVQNLLGAHFGDSRASQRMQLD